MKGKTGLWLAAALAAACMLALSAGSQKETVSTEERRIAEVLSAIAGAGRVEVAIFYSQTQESRFGSEMSVPTGAVVVAEGAGNLGVRLQMIRAIRTLLGLSENAVDVFVMEAK